METDKKSSANVLKSYLRYLKLERNYSQNTLDAYSHDITWLMDYCKREGLEMTALQLEDLQHFAATLHEFQIGPRSQSRILSGIRSFYRFLLLDGYIETDPTELLESPALGQHLPEVLSTTEVDMLEQSIDLSKPEGQRNRAIIEVLFSCGLRVSELVNLKLSQFACSARVRKSGLCPFLHVLLRNFNCGLPTVFTSISNPVKRILCS